MASEPKEIIRIDNIKLLKLISDPIRKKIIDVLYDTPLSASEIADEISFPKDKIYYHIKKLQSSDIIIIAESQKVKGITQNKFINAAKKFEIDPKLIGEEGQESFKESEIKPEDSQSDVGIEDDINEDIEEEPEVDETSGDDNPLLASLLKAKGKPAGQIPQADISTEKIKDQDPGAKPPPPETDIVRIIADRRRGGDRRTTVERRKGSERRVKQKRNSDNLL